MQSQKHYFTYFKKIIKWGILFAILVNILYCMTFAFFSRQLFLNQLDINENGILYEQQEWENCFVVFQKDEKVGFAATMSTEIILFPLIGISVDYKPIAGYFYLNLKEDTLHYMQDGKESYVYENAMKNNFSITQWIVTYGSDDIEIDELRAGVAEVVADDLIEHKWSHQITYDEKTYLLYFDSIVSQDGQRIMRTPPDFPIDRMSYFIDRMPDTK